MSCRHFGALIGTIIVMLAQNLKYTDPVPVAWVRGGLKLLLALGAFFCRL
jgi:hypothetical protein